MIPWQKRTVIATAIPSESKVTRLHHEAALEAARKAYGADKMSIVIVYPGELDDLTLFRKADAQVRREVSSLRGAAMRQAVDTALDLAGREGVVVWMEPAQWPLIDHLADIVRPLIQRRADIVVPCRHEIPRFHSGERRDAEQRVNSIFKHATGHSLDIAFGPFAASYLACRELFLKYQAGRLPDLLDATCIPIIEAILHQVPVEGAVVNYREERQADLRDAEEHVGLLHTLACAIDTWAARRQKSA